MSKFFSMNFWICRAFSKELQQLFVSTWKINYLLRLVHGWPALFMSLPYDWASETTHSSASFFAAEQHLWPSEGFFCIYTKLLSQNMFKYLRSVAEVLCNLVWLLEAINFFFLCITLSLLAIHEIMQQSSQGIGSGPKAKTH